MTIIERFEAATKPRRLSAKRENLQNMKTKIKPPKGYRWLKDGEMLTLKDFYINRFGYIEPSNVTGVIGKADVGNFVRRIPTTPTPAQAWRWLAKNRGCLSVEILGRRWQLYLKKGQVWFYGRTPLAAVRAAMAAEEKGGAK